MDSPEQLTEQLSLWSHQQRLLSALHQKIKDLPLLAKDRIEHGAKFAVSGQGSLGKVLEVLEAAGKITQEEAKSILASANEYLGKNKDSIELARKNESIGNKKEELKEMSMLPEELRTQMKEVMTGTHAKKLNQEFKSGIKSLDEIKKEVEILTNAKKVGEAEEKKRLRGKPHSSSSWYEDTERTPVDEEDPEREEYEKRLRDSAPLSQEENEEAQEEESENEGIEYPLEYYGMHEEKEGWKQALKDALDPELTGASINKEYIRLVKQRISEQDQMIKKINKRKEKKSIEKRKLVRIEVPTEETVLEQKQPDIKEEITVGKIEIERDNEFFGFDRDYGKEVAYVISGIQGLILQVNILDPKTGIMIKSKALMPKRTLLEKIQNGTFQIKKQEEMKSVNI